MQDASEIGNLRSFLRGVRDGASRDEGVRRST